MASDWARSAEYEGESIVQASVSSEEKDGSLYAVKWLSERSKITGKMDRQTDGASLLRYGR